MKIVTIVGARPQFVKAAVVSRAIGDNNESGESVREVIVHTGQHYDANMSDIFFDQMKIPRPDYRLETGGTTHGAMTGRMLEKTEEILLQEKPDVVLIYGDTNSTLAGALAGAKLHIPVAHVEAGLRSFNMRMPEEINRVTADRVSSWLFAPTETAVENLKKEGMVDAGRRPKGKETGSQLYRRVVNTGDVMYDAVLFYRQIAQPSEVVGELLKRHDDFFLATVHRAENTDEPERLQSIMSSLNKISGEKKVILPLHPRTRKYVEGLAVDNLTMIDPVGYFDMLSLLQNCAGVFTDSGGLQKEAYFFEKPCITLRDETEWVELVENGFNRLAGADANAIISGYENLGNMNSDYSMKLYGDGKAGNKILRALLDQN